MIIIKKYIKIILLVLVVILIFFIINTTRKIIIFGELEDKVVMLNTKDNIYYRAENEFQIGETYKKSNQVKTIITDKKTNEKQVTYDIESTNIIVNYAKHFNLFEKIKSGITASITTEKVNGKICYVISDKSNINWAVPKDCRDVKIYVEKETGLPIKHIIEYEDKTEIYTYHYSFDTVTDEDMKNEN